MSANDAVEKLGALLAELKDVNEAALMDLSEAEKMAACMVATLVCSKVDAMAAKSAVSRVVY